MYDELGFYNHYGNGDIFESREFVRTIMKMIPAKRYVYYNGKSPRLLMDIPNLEVDNNVHGGFLAMRDITHTRNKLYINTWIGRDGKYVLPGSGCTIEMLYQMYNDMLGRIGDFKLPGEPLDYLTDFDYSLYEIKRIDRTMDKLRHHKKVYISNGFVNSCQADNFDMTDLVNILATNLLRFDAILFVTEPVDSPYPNVIDANRLIPTLDSNLVELSYISRFCDMLIGRNSGPQVFAWTEYNCSRDVPNITLTYRPECSHFVHKSPIKMRKYWSNQTDWKSIYSFIYPILLEELKNE